jgi:hypothetical protein
MKLIVNDREYNYTIEPHFDKVRAEIYKVADCSTNLNSPIHIHLLSKTFGKWWRKPIKQDYDDAMKWADEQMDMIKKTNS